MSKYAYSLKNGGVYADSPLIRKRRDTFVPMNPDEEALYEAYIAKLEETRAAGITPPVAPRFGEAQYIVTPKETDIQGEAVVEATPESSDEPPAKDVKQVEKVTPAIDIAELEDLLNGTEGI